MIDIAQKLKFFHSLVIEVSIVLSIQELGMCVM